MRGRHPHTGRNVAARAARTPLPLLPGLLGRNRRTRRSRRDLRGGPVHGNRRRKMTRDEARQAIGMTARALLTGALSYIEGARKIANLRFPAALEWDSDIFPFLGIDSETDT